MKEFKITGSTLNSQFEYKNDSIIINGSITQDATNEKVQNINAQCYRKNGDSYGEGFGSFNGYPEADGGMRYDLSPMKRADSNLVWDAIDDIEAEIKPAE